MPKQIPVMPAAQIANAFELQDALSRLDITRNQFVALNRVVASYLPATVTFEQRTPKSVVTVTITNKDATYRLRVTNRSKVALLDMQDA